MGAESKIKKMQEVQDRVYELSAKVSENTAKAGLHRSKVEENHFHILANTTANGVALRDLATKGLESHLAICPFIPSSIRSMASENVSPPSRNVAPGVPACSNWNVIVAARCSADLKSIY